MKYMTFHVRVQITCADGSLFAHVFEEGSYVMADADHTVIDGATVYYTPSACIARAVSTFLSGLTVREREQAGRTLRIVANQNRALVDL